MAVELDSRATVAALPALLIDFGGVLTASVVEAFTTACAALAVDPEGFVAECFSADDGSPFALLEVGRIGIAEFVDLITPLLTNHSAEPVDGRRWFDLVQSTSWDIDEAMVAAVDDLIARGIPTVLVSNSWGTAADYPWDLLPRFSQTLVSTEVGIRKPDRRIYELAAQQVNRELSDCLFIDDVEVNLAPARELGMRTILHRSSAATIAELSGIYG
jgi:putative hydrolase of the HAD superfamily